MGIRAEHILRYLEHLQTEIAAHRDELTRLDGAIGDADHGTNLERGFDAVATKLPDLAGKDIGAVLKTVGLTLVSTVGGSSGPLYGTAFIRSGIALADQQEIDQGQLVVALEAALEGIQTRGRAQRGEKTIVDALAPAVDAMRSSVAQEADMGTALASAVAAAEQGMRATIPMIATKGRASYLGERSIGHQDPGATSTYLMLKAMLDSHNEQQASG
jgi:phosphoenolpyruvate---glycerone phosphotransferase subunit DhaL